MARQALSTTVVGSYPQPDWLVDRTLLSKGGPRVRLRSIWRGPEEILEQAQDDATVGAIRDMERASIDVISDGGIRRESYSNRPRLRAWTWTSPRWSPTATATRPRCRAASRPP